MNHPSDLSRAALAWLAAIGWAVLAWSAPARGARIPLAGVEASYGEAKTARLPQVIDGRDTGRLGWSVFPRTGEAHALFVRTAEPVRARAFDLTFCFLSGLPKRYFGSFALSYTTDAKPSLEGKWERVVPTGFTATGTTLTLAEDGRLTASGVDSMIGDAIFQIRVEAPQQAVTGFRVEVFPFERPDIPGPRVAWGEYKDFCLTEFRVEAVTNNTTNIALGRAARASGPLWADLSASVLTDGMPGSFNHPAQPAPGPDFYFEIDLGNVQALDHLALRSRGDGYAPDRMSRVQLRLYDRDPGTKAAPAWEAMDRADGTYPSPGAVDVVRMAQGHGAGVGRYLRISSDSQVAFSPQLAEVEVYPVLTAQVESVQADGRPLNFASGMEVPPGTAVLRIALTIPGSGLPDRLPIRWRLRGLHDDWQETDQRIVEITRPPAGAYQFEAQVGHTDREWDASALHLSVVVARHFWETPAFYVAAAGLAIGGTLLILRQAARRREAARLAAQRYEAALVEERTRIARDMHDEVGARLSQLALMQDLIVRRHALPPDTERSLRELAVSTRETVNALDQVVWAVNPLHDTLVGLAEYLSYAASSYFAPLDIACRLDAPYEWPEVVVRAQVRNQLILAFREALQNIVKHAGARTVTLTLRYEASQFTVVLTDDGRGLPPDLSGSGKEGLHNMKARLASIGGASEVRRRPEGGTEVRFQAPLTQATSSS